MLDRIDAIRCGAPMRLPLRSTASPCHAPRRRPAMLPRLLCAVGPYRFAGQARSPSRTCLRRASISLLRDCLHSPPRVVSASLHGGTSIPLHGGTSIPLHGVASASLHGVASIPLHGVASTLLHGRDDARKTADLRRRSPSPGGELQQKCEAMGTVALHRGFPLMRMIFFDKTPPWDPCLWGEVE